MLFQELEKLKRTSIMTSIVMIAMGIAMFMCPDNYIPSLIALMGDTMLILGIVLVLFFISGKKVLITYITFTAALALLLLGAAVLIFKDDTVRVIGVSFGLIQIVYGLSSLIHAATYTRRSQRQGWWILIVLSLLSILFGLVVLVNPWWNSTSVLLDVIGVMLLFSSVVNIVHLIFVWPLKSE